MTKYGVYSAKQSQKVQKAKLFAVKHSDSDYVLFFKILPLNYYYYSFCFIPQNADMIHHTSTTERVGGTA